MTKISAVVLLLTLCACADTPVIECHGTNWYRLGLDDGTAGAHGEAGHYATSCGADFGRAQYEEGFRDGLARRPKPVAAAEVAGTYDAVRPAASGGGERRVQVTLKPDGAASVSSAFSARPSRFLVEGAWQASANRIALTLEDGKRMAFELAGDRLTATQWDHAVWGAAGPGVLIRSR
jgi:hypothetical protein